nr:transposase [Candidatus Sigynarchaeota archaeon]
MYIIGSASLLAGKVFTAIAKRFNARRFCWFLQTLLVKNEGMEKIVLVLGNARVHHAKIIEMFQSLAKQELELIFFPQCLPKMNPIEQLWKFMREWITHDKFHPAFDGLLEDLRAFLESLKVPNEEVKSRCCFY